MKVKRVSGTIRKALESAIRDAQADVWKAKMVDGGNSGVNNAMENLWRCADEGAETETGETGDSSVHQDSKRREKEKPTAERKP